MKSVLVKSSLYLTLRFGIVAGGAVPSLAAENQLSKSEGNTCM